eukprot:2557279-Amphidinium_carterae.1
MRDRTTTSRAAGTGPLRTQEWLAAGRPLLEDKRIILHTDSAKAYASVFKTMRHTRVVHMKKKMDGKWLQPKYVETVMVDTGDGVVSCKAGIGKFQWQTQTVGDQSLACTACQLEMLGLHVPPECGAH